MERRFAAVAAEEIAALLPFGAVEFASDDLRGPGHVAEGLEQMDLLLQLYAEGIGFRQRSKAFQLRLQMDVELQHIRPGERVHGGEGEI